MRLEKNSRRYVNAFIKKDSIIIDGTASFFAKDHLKNIPGFKFIGLNKSWSFPRSPFTAHLLSDAFRQCDTIVNGSTGFDSLIGQFRGINEAVHYKDALELPPIIVTKTKPWLHQLRAYHFAKNLEACMLAMDMGTGKSKVAIDLICNLQGQPSKTFIFCPRYVVQVWPKQFQIHAGNSYVICAPEGGSVSKRLEFIKEKMKYAESLKTSFIAVMNYEMLRNESVQKFILSNRWDYGIGDELHRIKAPNGKTSRLLRIKIRRVCKRRLGLTGTPMPNTPMDAWAQYYFLDPGIYGISFWKFRNYFAVVDKWNKPVSYLHQEEFSKLFYSIGYRVSSDILDLPESQDIDRTCDFEPEARKIYNSMKAHMVAELESGVMTAANAAVKLIRLRQITSGHLPKDEDNPKEKIEVSTAKKELLSEVLSDLKINEPVVVFCQFHADLDNIHKVAMAQGRTSSELSGRMKNSDQYQAWANGETDILVAQIDAAREGIDCTRAKYAIYYSLGYSPGVFEQSKRRLLRPGQKNNVIYYHLLVRNSVDALVYKALKSKKNIIDFILEDLKNG